MRHCSGESVQVYEEASYGEQTLAEMLRKAATLVETEDHVYAKVSTAYDMDAGYTVTVYLH